MISGMTEKGKPAMPGSNSALPMYKVMAPGSWGGMQRNYRNKFFDFRSRTAQGASQKLIALNIF